MITNGDPENQQAVCDAISNKLQSWQSIFGEPAGSHSGGAFGEVPRLPSVPTVGSISSTGSNDSHLVGITILIYTSTSNYFDFSILEQGGNDSATDKQMKFVGLLKELCTQANCLLQLLPIAHVPLSKRHDLRRISIIAPSLSVLLDVLAVIHKMIAVMVPYDGKFMFQLQFISFR